MNQNINKRYVDHRQKSRISNSLNETRTANNSNHMDLGTYEVDNHHSSDHNNSDHVSINVGSSYSAQRKQRVDDSVPCSPLYSRTPSTQRRPAPDKTHRTPAITIPRPRPVLRGFNSNTNLQNKWNPQQYWRNNLQAAELIVNLTNRWMVILLHFLLEIVKAVVKSRRIPSLELLELIPVFSKVQYSFIKKPLHRKKCTPANLIAEEEAIRREGFHQTSIQEILDEIQLYRGLYNKDLNPRYQQSHSNSHNKPIFVDLTSPENTINEEIIEDGASLEQDKTYKNK